MIKYTKFILVFICSLMAFSTSASVFNEKGEIEFFCENLQEGVGTKIDFTSLLNVEKNEIDFSFNDFSKNQNEKLNEKLNEKENGMEVVTDFSLKGLYKPSAIALNYIKGKKGIPTKEELDELSAIYGIPENLFYSLMLKESQGLVYVQSSKNARGLFQFLPETARQFGLVVNDKVDERVDIWKSAEASARYLAWIFTYLHPEKDRSVLENYNYTLAAYNAGIGNVKKNGVVKIPNFKETIAYVNIIIGHSKGELYLIKKGDMLNKISEKVDLPIADIRSMNGNITDQKLIAGRYLRIQEKVVLM